MARTVWAAVAVAVVGCVDQPHGPWVFLEAVGAPSGTPLDFVEGGARATLVMGTGVPVSLSGLKVVSSDPEVLEVLTQPAGDLRFEIKTGKVGVAKLTVSDAQGMLLNTSIAVLKAARLLPQLFEGTATSAQLVAHETASLVIVPQTSSRARLLGRGTVQVTLTGVLDAGSGDAGESEDRFFLTGAPGSGTVHSTLGGLSLDVPITVLGPPALTVVVKRDPNVTNIDCFPDGGCVRNRTFTLDVSVGNGAPAWGGACTWTTGGATVVVDHTALSQLQADPGKRGAVVRLDPDAGSAWVRCDLGGAAHTLFLP